MKQKDKKYKNIVKDIIRNNDFKKLYNIEHHGISRWEHLNKISYYSYKIARKLNFNCIDAARGGLLHDFFLDGNERTKLKKFTDTFTHPKKALKTANDNFYINDVQSNIIISHMFPLYLSIPKYKESILVHIVDKVIGGHEMINEYRYKFNYQFNYLYILLIIFMTN